MKLLKVHAIITLLNMDFIVTHLTEVCMDPSRSHVLAAGAFPIVTLLRVSSKLSGLRPTSVLPCFPKSNHYTFLVLTSRDILKLQQLQPTKHYVHFPLFSNLTENTLIRTPLTLSLPLLLLWSPTTIPLTLQFIHFLRQDLPV